MGRLAWKSWVWLMLFVVVLTTLGGSVGTYYIHESTEDDMRDGLKLSVDYRVDQWNRLISSKGDLISGVSRSRDIVRWSMGDRDDVSRYLDDVLKTDLDITETFVVNKKHLSRSSEVRGARRTDRSIREWYERVKDYKNVHVSRVEKNEKGRLVVLMSFPVYSDRSDTTVLGMEIDVSTMAKRTKSLSDYGDRSEIVSSEGVVVSSGDSRRIGTQYVEASHTKLRYGKYISGGWRVEGSISDRVYDDYINRDLKYVVYGIVLFAIGGSLLGLLLVFVWLRPIRILERKAKKLGSNDIWDLDVVRTNDALETIDDGMNVLLSRTTQVEEEIVNTNRMMRTSLMNAVDAVMDLTDRVDERIVDLGDTRSKVSSLLRRVGSGDVEMIQMEQEIRSGLEDVISMKREISEVSLLSERLVKMREEMDVTVYEEFSDVVTSMRDICGEARDLANDLKERSNRGSLLAVALSIDAERSDEFGNTFLTVSADVRREFVRLGDAMTEMDGKIRVIEKSITGGMFDERSPLLWKSDIERMLSELTFILESWSNMDGRMSDLLVRMNSRLLRMLSAVLEARKVQTTTVEELGELLRDMDRLSERFESEKRAMGIVNYSNDQMYGLTEKIVDMNIRIAQVNDDENV